MTVRLGIGPIEAQALAEDLRRQREALGLPMRQAAHAAGVSLATLSRAEAKDQRLSAPSIRALRAWLAVQGKKEKAA